MNKYLKVSLTLLLLMIVFIGVLFVANAISNNPEVLNFISQFGYFGVMFTAIVAGLNTFIPLPAATFIPLFLSSGMSLSLILITLAVGTTIADFIGFAFGNASRHLIKEKYPKIFDYFYNLQKSRSHLIIPLVILYAAFVPFPNEAILIPLALAGVRFKLLILPLIIANLIHQIILYFGISTIINFF